MEYVCRAAVFVPRVMEFEFRVTAVYCGVMKYKDGSAKHEDFKRKREVFTALPLSSGGNRVLFLFRRPDFGGVIGTCRDDALAIG